MILPANSERSTYPLVTLTTDFGLADHYVGTMKGAILSRCVDVAIVDVTHQVAKYSLFEGAYAIAQAAPYFPAGTVHVVVVDPGVGTARRAVAVKARDQMFVAPDNGVLSMVLDGLQYEAYAIENRELMATAVAQTFHGRDVFGPVAAALACKAAELEEVGRRVEALEQLPGLHEEKIGPKTWVGRVLSVDQFGNIITNFRAKTHFDLGRVPFRLQLDSGEVNEYYSTFGEAPTGICFAYIGSSGFIEIGMNRENAAAQLGAEVGSQIGCRFDA